MASKSEVLRRVPVCVRWAIHPGARASRPHPYTCKQPAIQGHSLARRTKPAFTGFSSIVPGSLCGRDARAPGWSLCGRDARAPGWSFFTSRSASTASMAKGGADGRNDHQIDRLAGGRIRARWRSWHVTGWRRSPKCCGGLLFVFGGQSTRERGRPARILIPANSLPSKATPLQGAPNPPLRGALPSCRGLCGRDARAPGWSLCGRDARAPGWSFFTSRSASTASMAKGGADGRNDHQIDRLAGGRIRARWRSWHVTGWRRSPKCCGGLLFVFGGQSTRERGRPARILIPANSLSSIQDAPLPCKP